MQRQIALDTETTGLDHRAGHRIIEIGCVEIVDRRLTGRHFHTYLQPDREIDPEAQAVHGISAATLAEQPRFADVAEDLMAYLAGAEVIIHNAAFDVGFLDAEWQRYGQGWANLAAHCTIVDTLLLARDRHPGQKNSLDALCKRYHIDNSQRVLHGALIDADLLAKMYLAMTAGQYDLSLDSREFSCSGSTAPNIRATVPVASSACPAQPLPAVDRQAHLDWLAHVAKLNGAPTLWSTLEQEAVDN